MRLESGAPRSSKIYWMVIVVVTTAVSGWFLWDWKSGYAKKNAAHARRDLGLTEDQALDLSASYTKTDYRKLEASKPTGLNQISAALGEPYRKETASDGSMLVTYVSQYGKATVAVEGRRVRSMTWQTWKFEKREIEAQFYWASAVALFTLWAIFKTIKTASLRVTMDDEGMRYDGMKIAYADMFELTGFSPKGWVFLNYRAGGQEQKLRLDNQRVEKYEEIILAICDNTDLKSPFPISDAADDGDAGAAEEAE